MGEPCAGEFFFDFGRQGFETFVHTPITGSSSRCLLHMSLGSYTPQLLFSRLWEWCKGIIHHYRAKVLHPFGTR